MPSNSYRPVAAGLFLVTLATLVLEILDSRLLSVVTWYHLAFLAVSLAMLGMAAGAVLVFLRGDDFSGARAIAALPRLSLWLAVAIPASHIANLAIPIPVIERISVMDALALALSTVILAAPFVLSGIVVTIALTRTGGPIGRLYAADLLGAALGCVVVIPLLNLTNISSVAFVAGAAAAAAAILFQRFAGGGVGKSVVVTLLLLVVAAWNAWTPNGIGVMYPKNRLLWARDVIQWSAWNTHSYVVVSKPITGPAHYWGPGQGSERFATTFSWMVIDGEAGTPITQWNGDPAALEWVQYDITSTPYHLRRGDVAIIGVGGGRDVLSAIWGRNQSITGIEINDNLLHALEGPYRQFAGIADRPDVTLVHSEARSYLSRTKQQFDVLQMSLIDTWAATGAGAFTLTENGLYTREGWRVFLDRLKPGGVFSVSRWFAPTEVSETSRLVTLAVAALLDRGIKRPSDHIIMIARPPVATLMLSNEPFNAEDRQTIGSLAASRGYSVLLSPWTGSGDQFLSGIVRSASAQELAAASAHPRFDFSPPTDERPFFFNTLKPTSFYAINEVGASGVVAGNMRATWTLVLLFAIAVLLVGAIIVYPLMRSGLPSMDGGSFVLSLSYFALIGVGYMLIQIPLLQRFSVYLGHPTYTFAVILLSMIFFTGVGSFVSDRFPLERHAWVLKIPLAIGVAVLLLMTAIQPLMDRTIHLELPARSAIVVLCTGPIALLLGFCFPIGIGLVGRLSSDATAWMWGVNGACGVLASIAAVGISMWLGIDTNFLVAAAAYFLLVIPTLGLARRVGPLPTAAAASYLEAAGDKFPVASSQCKV